jgi:hypothetical protein
VGDEAERNGGNENKIDRHEPSNACWTLLFKV